MLCEYQKIIDNAQNKISNIVNTIEETVAHASVTDKNTIWISDEKFGKLKKLIVDGYRNKLLMKKLIRKSVVTLGGHHELLQPSFSPATLLNDNNNPPSNLGKYSASNNIENASTAEENTEQDKSSCNLIITKVTGSFSQETEAFNTENGDSSVFRLLSSEIKEEGKLLPADDSNFRGTKTGTESASDEEVYMVPLRKRRLLFQDVEIFNCVSLAKGKFLQCSLCNNEIEIPKRGTDTGGMTPYMKMKLHIQRSHTNQETFFLKDRRPRTFVCLTCHTSFENIRLLREHRKIHPVNDAPLQCDICGRPMKDNSYRNLLIHKFSHKNDEERFEAIAAGERVTKNTLLSSQLNRRLRLKGSKNRNINNGSSKCGNDSQVKNQLSCRICGRSFSRSNYLILHLRGHVAKDLRREEAP